MHTISRLLMALALVSGPYVARAAAVEGTFSGTVVPGGFGTIGTLDASTVAAGTRISGTFSYDSQIFVLGGLNENGYFIATGSANPVVITITVAGSTFTVHGTIQSELNLVALPSSNNPNNHFYLSAANWGPSVPGLSGSIDLNLSNYLGAPFASNIDDPSSVAFTNQSGLGVNEVDTLQAIDSAGTGTAALYFTLNNASTVPGTPPVAQLLALQAEINGIGPEGVQHKVTDALSHVRAVCTSLTKFVSEVQAQDGKRINQTLAAQLLNNADAIEVEIGCNLLPAD
jgi:hypothetical protein